MELGEQDVLGKVSVNFTKDKNGKKRQIIRIDTSNFSFYTTASKKDEISLYEVVALSVQAIEDSFKDYISGTFYMPSYDRAVIKKDDSLRQRAINSSLPSTKTLKFRSFSQHSFLAQMSLAS